MRLWIGHWMDQLQTIHPICGLSRKKYFLNGRRVRLFGGKAAKERRRLAGVGAVMLLGGAGH